MTTRADRVETALRALTDWARFDPTYDPNRDALVFEAQEALAMPADPPATPSEAVCPECKGAGMEGTDQPSDEGGEAFRDCHTCGGSGRATPSAYPEGKECRCPPGYACGKCINRRATPRGDTNG